MTSLRRDDFATYFAEMHGGSRPFAWQERLLDAVLESGRWPERVVAPTGAGKTAVIDVHVFGQALCAGRSESAPPRRLAMVVDRRVLVDDQYAYARTLARRLAHPDGHSVLASMAEALWTCRSPDPEQVSTPRQEGESPLTTARLRGGVPPSRGWRHDPTAAAVICATPDMWGSRLLFRGYGSSARAWPQEAGLLAFDSVVVVDEAHLARQLLCTARRVADLATVAERPLTVTPLQVVETTATPADEGLGSSAHRSVGVGLDDLVDDTLAARLRRSKPVTIVQVDRWDNAKALGVAAVEAVERLLPDLEGAVGGSTTVGCFVNTVAGAVGVAHALRSRQHRGRSLRVVMICGQARPIDIELLETTYPGLLSPQGNANVDVLVSTQSLEVGVDLDLAALVTDLAVGTALAQRAGRVNRRGRRPTGPITVLVPDVITDRTQSGPYDAVELQDALEWITRRAADQDGLSPWAIREDPPPQAAPRRTLFQRPELGQAWHWARTSDDLAADPDLTLWLSESLEEETAVSLVVRDRLPDDPSEATTLIRALRPRPHETFPVPYRLARAALSAASDALGAAVVVRGDDVAPLEWQTSDERDAIPQPRIRPGDEIVIDASLALFTLADDNSPPVVVPVDNGVAVVDRYPVPDRLEARAQLPEHRWQEHEIGGVVLRVEGPAGAEGDNRGPQHPLAAALGADPSPAELRTELRTWLSGLDSPTRMQHSAAALLATRVYLSDVVTQRSQGRIVRVLVIDNRRATADDNLRQVRTFRGDDVTLSAHQQAVADRAAHIARHLGLAPDLVEMMRSAGAHHDDGKQDPRFQRVLGATTTTLAKSPGSTTADQARRRLADSGLPQGWRHEQRSVVDAWAAISDCADRDLVARLIGTSHGHGRSGFPHAGHELLEDDASVAGHLFDTGEWDELIERTQTRYGVWGCAFLESLLRSADGQVSGEGR